MFVPSFLINCLAVLASSVWVGQAVPLFHINLDLDPELRWKDVAEYYKSEMIHLFKAIDERTSRQVGDKRQDWLDTLQFSDEHLAEMQGIVDAVAHPQVSLDVIKLWNAIYELESPVMCSATLEALQNGTVIHGRNMDYVFMFEMPDGRKLNLPDVTFELLFSKKGEQLIHATQWPGLIGIHTGMRLGPGGYTFDQQTRHTNKWELNLAAAKKGGMLFMSTVRTIMEETSTYSDAFDKLYEYSWMAPQYFIMAGAGAFEGAVLTIDRLGVHEPETPVPQKLGQDGGWHLVQTNDDLNRPPEDIRRGTANWILNNTMVQTNIDLDQITKFMHSPPLFHLGNVFTAVMVPSTGFYKTIKPDEPPFFVDPSLRVGTLAGVSAFGMWAHSIGLDTALGKALSGLGLSGGSGKLELTQSRTAGNANMRRLRRQPLR